MKYWSLGLGVFILIFILLLVGRFQDNSAPVAGAGCGVNSPRPRVSQVTADSPGAVRLVNRVKLAEVGNTIMLQYYEKDSGDQWLYFLT